MPARLLTKGVGSAGARVTEGGFRDTRRRAWSRGRGSIRRVMDDYAEQCVARVSRSSLRIGD